jgi:hypothetical protein
MKLGKCFDFAAFTAKLDIYTAVDIYWFANHVPAPQVVI